MLFKSEIYMNIGYQQTKKKKNSQLHGTKRISHFLKEYIKHFDRNFHLISSTNLALCSTKSTTYYIIDIEVYTSNFW